MYAIQTDRIDVDGHRGREDVESQAQGTAVAARVEELAGRVDRSSAGAQNQKLMLKLGVMLLT